MSAGRRIERRPSDLIWLVAGAVVLVLCALPVHADRVDGPEATAFRLVNDLPSVPFGLVWVPMQLGNLLVVPAAVLAALAFRHWRLAAGLALAGAGVVEAVLITGLTAAGGDKAQVVAAVLVYRALTWGLPVLVGVVCLLWWRKQTLTAPAESASSTGAARP